VSYRSPEPFITDADLNEEQSDASLLLNVCRELLVRLERFLTSRQVAVQQIEFSFFHLQLPATHLNLGCVQPDRAVLHWFDLLGIRFERLELPAPVIAIRLCAGQGHEFTAETGALPFGRKQVKRQDTAITHLAERLAARIGDECVHGVHTVAEHRPQYAWDACYRFDEVPRCASSQAFAIDSHAPELLADIRRTQRLVLRRPLWMLKEPEPLRTDRDTPCYQGPLELVSGPERLETGWWDDDGIARDYFVAVNPKGIHLWIYRDRNRNRNGHRWYLHGMFG
jgi:protein ImuB